MSPCRGSPASADIFGACRSSAARARSPSASNSQRLVGISVTELRRSRPASIFTSSTSSAAMPVMTSSSGPAKRAIVSCCSARRRRSICFSHVVALDAGERVLHRGPCLVRVSLEQLGDPVEEATPIRSAAPTTSVVEIGGRKLGSSRQSLSTARPDRSGTRRREEEPTDRPLEATRERHHLARRRCSAGARCRTSSRSPTLQPDSGGTRGTAPAVRSSAPASSPPPHARVGSCRRRSGGRSWRAWSAVAACFVLTTARH